MRGKDSLEKRFHAVATKRNPERERSTDLREKLRDPLYLPSHDDVRRIFKPEGDFWLEWHKFCFDKENPVFEFLNEEFLESLMDYLAQRIEELQATPNSPVRILEVGAGNGRLSHFLRQKLGAKSPDKVKVMAVDSGKWNLKPAFPIDNMGHKDALQKYKPHIVIFSWMPYREDCTDDFRAAESVDEYILIGETDGGCCGDEWRTWGMQPWSADEGESAVRPSPPYVADGFERQDLDEISKHQICRTDAPWDFYHSRTVSFKRKT